MRIHAKVTAEQFQEMRRIVWAKHYWLTLFNNFVFHQVGIFPLMLVTLAGTIAVSWLSSSFGWSPYFLGCSVGGLAFAVFLVAMQRSQLLSPRKLTRLNKDLPAWIELGEDGVTLQADDAIQMRVPWQKFKGWKDGRTLKVLIGDGENYVILPTADFDEETQASIVALISEHLPLFQETLPKSP